MECRYNFFDVKSFRNLVYYLNCVLNSYFMNYCFFLSVRNSYNLINDSLDRLFHFNIHIFDNFNLNNFLLDDWNLDLAFNFFYDNLLSFYFHELFHDFRNFNNFLNDSGDCD